MVLPWLTKTKEQKQKYSPKFVLAKLNFSLCLPVWVPEQQLQQRQRHREGLTGTGTGLGTAKQRRACKAEKSTRSPAKTDLKSCSN